MAEADVATVEAGTVKLQVAAARQEESGRGIARMPKSVFASLGITETVLRLPSAGRDEVLRTLDSYGPFLAH